MSTVPVPGKKVFVETWGCQMNELDSRRLVGLMARVGYAEIPSADGADLLLLNTCSVRDKAEQKVYDALGRFGQLKRERPGLVIGVCGCVAQQEGRDLLERSPHVDFVLGTGRIEALPAVVARVIEEGDRPVEVGFDPDDVAYTPAAVARDVRHKAAITVIEGCNKNCTFCIVPTTRGRERSRRLEAVVAESQALIDQGVIEIELLGQTVNAFRDPITGQGLADLLRAIGALSGLKRLRFVTSHPRNFGADLIRAMAEVPAVCPSLHLPVQSGSDRVLGRMKRQYVRREYLDLVSRLRKARPKLALATDVIVGFPGETDENFEETLSLLREVRFSSVFAFTYSPRPFTAAARWDNDIPPLIASRRLARLEEAQQGIQRELNEALEGEILEVLVDGVDRKGRRCAGRSPCNRVVNIESPTHCPPGTLVDVRIEKGLPNSLLGSPVTQRSEGKRRLEVPTT